MIQVKIGRSQAGYSPDMAAKKFNQDRIKAMEEMYTRCIPAFYRKLIKHSKIFDKAIKVYPVFISRNKEEVSLYFFGVHKETIQFIYF